MKYLTRDLWEDLQDEAKGKAAAAEWDRNLTAYLKELEELKGRLTEDAAEFFSKADVHDGHLQRFTLAEPLVEYPDDEEAEPLPQNDPVRVDLAVLDGNADWVWRLSYAHVRKAHVEFPTASPLFYSTGEGLGDWGYHELTDAGGGFLRHEVLFASGATIVIEFKDLRVKRSAWK